MIETKIMASKKRYMIYITAILLVGLIILAYNSYYVNAADTAPSVSIVDIDYDALTMTVQAKGKDSLIFVSNKSQKKWELISSNKNEKNQFTFDISWISKSSDYVLSLKGNYSTTPVKVTIPKEKKNFKVTIDYDTNRMKYSGLGESKVVYWRKNDSTKWNPFIIGNASDEAAFANKIETFSLKGGKIYVRLGQVNGTSIDNPGERPSKEVYISISKRAGVPTVSVDYSKLRVSVKSAMEYKKSTSNTWIPITTSTLSLLDIAKEAMYSSSNTKPSEVSLDFRTASTSSKVASQTKTIVINPQEVTPSVNVVFEYLGSNQCQIIIDEYKSDDGTVTIEGASTSNPYEYTIVNSGENLDYDKATWSSITSSKAVIFTSTKAPAGSTIYVRMKNKSGNLSTYPVALKVSKYPAESTVNQGVDLEKISGVAKDMTFGIKVPRQDTKVSSITFNGKAVTYTTNEGVRLDDGTYLLTITITNVESVEKVSSNLDTKIEGIIKLDNGDVIEKGVNLTILSPVTVSTTTNFVKYKDIAYNKAMEVKINMGNSEKTDVTVTSITANNYTIGFTQTKMDSDKIKSIVLDQTSIVAYEKQLFNAKLGTAIPLVITFSNGEVISSGANLTIESPGIVSGSNSSFAFSYTTYMKTVNDDKATDIANPVIKVTINDEIYSNYNNLKVSSVKWKGQSITSIVNQSGKEITIELSVDRMAEIYKSMTSGTGDLTGSLDITLSYTLNSKNVDLVTFDYGYTISVHD